MKISRLYALLLRLYPESFYKRFGDEMLEVFERAWNAPHQSGWSRLIFCIRELTGLFISIAGEQWSERKSPVIRKLFHWYLIPFWLLGISFTIGAVYAWSYWGYVIRPSTTFTEMATVDSISLVEFDDSSYLPTAIPINELPYVKEPDFPVSQILPYIPDHQQPLKQVNPELAELVSNALMAENIDIGQNMDYPTEPTQGVNGCISCFQIGIQRQADGSLLMIWPEFDTTDLPFDNLNPSIVGTSTHRITPSEWSYFNYIVPAGYIVTGQADDGTPLIFVSIVSGTVGDYQNHYYEYLFDASSDTLTIRDQIDYRFNMAGLEIFTAGSTTLTLLIPMLIIFFIVMLFRVLMNLAKRRNHYPPVAGPA